MLIRLNNGSVTKVNRSMGKALLLLNKGTQVTEEIGQEVADEPKKTRVYKKRKKKAYKRRDMQAERFTVIDEPERDPEPDHDPDVSVEDDE
jgi:hypothetical protein